MRDDNLTTLVLLLVLFAAVVGVVAVIKVDIKLGDYRDTIEEYMMCVKYNSDCECSDIILSEYSEEVE